MENKTILNKNAKGYGYKYTDLAEIHEYLESINVRYIQTIKRIDSDDYIFTKRCFDGKWEDEWLQGCKVVDAVLSGIKNPAQEQGSALTYARRYSLLMAFGLATDDDDAQSLTQPVEMSKEEAEKYTLTFGKHKGKKISELDNGYIDWLLNNSKDAMVIKAIELITGQVPLSEEQLQENIKEQVDKNEIFIKFQDLADKTNTDIEEICTHYEVDEESKLSQTQLLEAISIMERKNK